MASRFDIITGKKPPVAKKKVPLKPLPPRNEIGVVRFKLVNEDNGQELSFVNNPTFNLSLSMAASPQGDPTGDLSLSASFRIDELQRFMSH